MATKKKAGTEEKVKAKKGAKADEVDAEDEDAEETDDADDEEEDQAPPARVAAPARPAKQPKVEKPGKSDASPKKKVAAPIAPRAPGSAPVYQQSQSYSVGDVIYHAVWNTEGKVLEVGETTQGHKKIIVDFQGLGKKTLIAAYVEEDASAAAAN